MSTQQPPLGGFIKRISETSVCGRRLKIFRWELSADANGCHEALVALVASAHVSGKQRLLHPEALVGPKLAERVTVRDGDFGELLAWALYSERLGHQVPFQKLEHKPVMDATQQGADVLALTVSPGGTTTPVLLEVKYRTKAKVNELTKAIGKGLQGEGQYLVSAWRHAVESIEDHPDGANVYGLTAAQVLAELNGTPDTPRHDKHAVIVAPPGNVQDKAFEAHWGVTPPVSQLHILRVPGLSALMNRVYEDAAKVTYGDLSMHMPRFIVDAEVQPGANALVSSRVAELVGRAARSNDVCGLMECALWFLADWDGVGAARAEQLRKSNDPSVAGLARVLAGSTRRSDSPHLRGEKGNELSDQVSSVAVAAWQQRIGPDEVLTETEDLATGATDDALALAVRLVGKVIAYRLKRHPQALVAASGPPGLHVSGVVRNFLRYSGKALWPSQAKALSAGLLDSAEQALVIKMPTSAGKTLLIELVAAHSLDSSQDSGVVVIAPTRALARQLTHDLRDRIRTADVRAVHGGMDFDTDSPDSPEPLLQPGITVLTPERFDLEWRRNRASEDARIEDVVNLVVVDEAHLLTETNRGPLLELSIARALRAGIRVVLLSSQFANANVSQLAAWVDGESVVSDWTPTWLERQVYFPRPGPPKIGLVQGETGEATQRLTLTGKPQVGVLEESKPDLQPAAAALAELASADGLVVIFTDKKSYAAGLATNVMQRFGTHVENPKLDALATTVETVAPDAAEQLRCGVGVHHADVPGVVRSAIERAARSGWLRCVICTSTLLEGVDFPTKTVIAAYPPRTNDSSHKISVGRMRNLAGRAGRAGRHVAGTIICMFKSEDKALDCLLIYREELPATRSALYRALASVRSTAHRRLGDVHIPFDDLDGLLLIAVIEGAVPDGNLRRQIEDLLGRTLWFADNQSQNRDALLDRADARAQALGGWLARSPATTAFYRSGLKSQSCRQLHTELAGQLAPTLAAVDQPNTVDDALVSLLVDRAPVAAETRWPDDLTATEGRLALRAWLAGTPQTEIEATHELGWKWLSSTTESLLPWVLTGIIEILAAQADDPPTVRSHLHGRLDIARIRYGVPAMVCCEWVRRGLDRTRVAQLHEEFSAVDQFDGSMDIFEALDWSFESWVPGQLTDAERLLLGMDPVPVDDEPW